MLKIPPQPHHLPQVPPKTSPTMDYTSLEAQISAVEERLHKINQHKVNQHKVTTTKKPKTKLQTKPSPKRNKAINVKTTNN